MGAGMRYILSIMVLVMSLFSADIDWSHDYEKALSQAKKEHKLVYVLITSDSCRWCRKFEKTTLEDEAIKKRLYAEFVTVHLSRNRDNIPKQFEKSPVPRHYFTDFHAEILYSALGYRDIETFDSFMSNAEDKYNKNLKKIKEKK